MSTEAEDYARYESLSWSTHTAEKLALTEKNMQGIIDGTVEVPTVLDEELTAKFGFKIWDPTERIVMNLCKSYLIEWQNYNKMPFRLMFWVNDILIALRSIEGE